MGKEMMKKEATDLGKNALSEEFLEHKKKVSQPIYFFVPIIFSGRQPFLFEIIEILMNFFY